MNDKCSAKEPSVPIFMELIQTFESIYNALNDNANFIYFSVNSIREKSEPSNEKPMSSNSISVVDQLLQQISQLREVNYKLSLIRENLKDLVG